jgi:hypothetical protein
MAGIATVMVLAPGTSQAGGYDFDFCIHDLTPVCGIARSECNLP